VKKTKREGKFWGESFYIVLQTKGPGNRPEKGRLQWGKAEKRKKERGGGTILLIQKKEKTTRESWKVTQGKSDA